jgi:hypothetical protein
MAEPVYQTTPSDLVPDSKGVLFSPGGCSHVYGRDTSGNITTDVATDGFGVVRTKTFTYTSNQLTGESAWVAS